MRSLRQRSGSNAFPSPHTDLPSLTEVWINVDLATPEDIAMVHQAIKHKYRGVDTLYGETPDGGKYVVVRRRKGEC